MYTVSRKSLLRAVKLAASIVPRATPKAMLKGMLIEGGKGCLIVKVTDTEMSIAIHVTAEGTGQAKALPDAQKIVATLTESDCQHLKLSKEGDELILASDFAETVLKDCDEPEGYPFPVANDPEKTIVVTADKLHQTLKRITMYCAGYCAYESARYALKGVKFERIDGKLCLVATDGKWMATQELDCPTSEATTDCLIVPEKAIRTLLNATRGDEGEVIIGFTGNCVTFHLDGVTLHTRLVEGRYPTWREVFPKKIEVKLPLNAGSLLRVTRQAAVMMTKDTRGIDYIVGKSTLTAKSSDANAGKAKIQLPIAYDGKPHTVTFDGRLMAGMLSQWDGDTEFEACLTGNNTVAEFRFPDGFRALIVPLSRNVQ
jgi:DNA polymerase III subunit beta